MKLFKHKNSEFENGQKTQNNVRWVFLFQKNKTKSKDSKQRCYGQRQSTRAQINGIPNICTLSISH